jgi:class 3 adenylate cyclase/tetratricopeptide (TPR) repeat protein
VFNFQGVRVAILDWKSSLPAGRIKDMHPIVDNFILERYKSGQTQGDFPAVVMFVDVSGFSALTDALMTHGQHGAEILAAVMRLVLKPLIHCVYAQGGFVATQAGDAFTALFPIEDSGITAERALAAATSIQEWVVEHPHHQTPYGEFSISVKAGLSLGPIHWGIISSADGSRATYYFQGDALDSCSEAEHCAGPGDVIIDARLQEVLDGKVRTQTQSTYYRVISVEADLPIPQAVNAPPADLSLLSRFIPGELLTQPQTGEFRMVVFLFIHLPSVRTEGQLNIFMQTLFDLQDHYGGLLNRLDFGDKGAHLLLFWGAPAAFENDVDRCLSFTLDLQARTSIPISAGVTYQLAHAGFIGSDLHEEYTCYGRGANLAARFMSAASRGEIWLDDASAKNAGRWFEVEFAGEQAFKGFSEKQRVYHLLERKEQSQFFFKGELVGRQDELIQMVEFIQPVFDRQYAGALVVLGDPGIGKSRLVYEFQNSALFRERQVLWALCQVDEILRQSLNPFRYWLKHFFEQSVDHSESRNKRNFNRVLDDLVENTADKELASDLDRTRSFLGGLLALHWPDSLYEQLDPQSRYESTFNALIALYKALSLQRPLILVIEDTQWLDADSQAFLPALARALTAVEGQSFPIAILATARIESAGLPWADALNAKTIRLEGLKTEELSHLAVDVLGGPAVPALLDLLAQRSEGNPLFAEQVLRYWQEEGALELDSAGWNLQEKHDGSLPLPTSLRAVLVARLDRLAREVQEVVQTAAVLGREFEVRLLAHMLQSDETLPRKVEKAEQAGIWTALSELQYFFKHALLRDTAYRMQLRTRRQELHRLAVEALETLYADDLDHHYNELAYHSEKAGLPEQARRYYGLAGDIARGAFQNNLAADLYSRAIALAPAGDLPERFSLHAAREAVYDLLGKRDEQRQDLQILQSLADDLYDDEKRIDVLVKLADFHINLGSYQEAARYAQEAISMSLDTGLRNMALAAHRAVVSTSYRMGEIDAAFQHGGIALQLCREFADRSTEGKINNLYGMIVLDGQNLVGARDYFQKSLNCFLETGELRAQAMALNNLGMVTGFMGDYPTSQEYYEKSLAITQKIGFRSVEGYVVGNLGWVAGMLGDFTTARSYASQSIRIGREVGSRASELYGLINLSTYSCALGDYKAALSYAGQGLDMGRAIQDHGGEAWAFTVQGHAYAALDRLSEASAAYQAALEIRTALEQTALASEPRAGLARVALAQKDPSAALAYISPVLVFLDGGGSLDGTEEPLRVFLTCYQVLQAVDDPRAAQILEVAFQQLRSRADKITDPAASLRFLEDIPYHRQILDAWERNGGSLADNK